MKVTELRVNNWYKSVKFNVSIQMELSDLSELHHRCFGAEIDSEIINEFIEPIELTEEWLRKFKFHQKYITDPQEQHCDQLYWLDDFKIYVIDDGKYFKLWWGDDMLIELKYVHRLQNLYFELKNKELTIK
jgi:hypothetical protein